MPLTQKDLGAIKYLMEVTIDEKDLLTKSDINHLPTKDEFYEEMGKVTKELNDVREEQSALTHRVSENSDQLATLVSN